MTDRITIIQADITTLPVDAIVNAADASLRGGGGVDGAIHRAAGPGLLEACHALGGCHIGDARLTPAFNLQASWVIHTVGPIWQGGQLGEDVLLALCYRASLALASKAGARTVAFPAISTGAYGYPMERAACIAMREIGHYLADHPEITQVTIAVRGDDALHAHRAAMQDNQQQE